MTPVTERPIPDGFTLDWNEEIWNVGHVFVWSEVFGRYLKTAAVTVKPKESLADAMERGFFAEMSDGGKDRDCRQYEIFFVEKFNRC